MGQTIGEHCSGQRTALAATLARRGGLACAAARVALAEINAVQTTSRQMATAGDASPPVPEAGRVAGSLQNNVVDGPACVLYSGEESELEPLAASLTKIVQI